MASAEDGSAAFMSTVNCYSTLVKSPATAALTDFTVHQEVIEDVLDAVKALRAQATIDPARVFVLYQVPGHVAAGRDPRHRGLDSRRTLDN